MASPRSSDPSGRRGSKLYVEPAELARKLVKELEGTKVSRAGQTWVRDQYTVFLCREDYARFRSHLDELVRKLESHVEKHVHSRRYATSGAITVELTMDPDLKPGYFGVLADRGGLDDSQSSDRPAAQGGRSAWDVAEDDYEDGYDDDYATENPRGAGVPVNQGYGGAPFAGGPSVSPPLPRTPALGVPGVGASMPAPSLPGAPPALGPSYGRPYSAPPAADRPSFGPPPLAGQSPQAAYPAPSPAQPRPAPSAPPMAGTPRPVSPAEAVPASGEPLVLKVNGQERVFPQGKAVIGRSRDVDLQIDNADVSRRHAMIYWSEGSIVVKDLGSTNGTMVNGYPVDSTVVRPSDVIRIGNAHITAAAR